MIRTSIEKMAYEIGYDIGLASDQDQANLLNGLAHGLTMGCGMKIGTQLCYVSDKLSAESKNIITELKGFLDIVGEEK